MIVQKNESVSGLGVARVFLSASAGCGKSEHSPRLPKQCSAPSSRRVAECGQIVRSLAGRDKGAVYLICGSEQAGFVLLSDGRKRSLASPKRKNARHLQPMGKVAADLAQAFKDGTVTDEHVRAAINAMIKVKEGD